MNSVTTHGNLNVDLGELVRLNNLFNVVFLLFLTLKLCGSIDWPWYWVVAPLLGNLAFLILGILFMVAWYRGLDERFQRFVFGQDREDW